MKYERIATTLGGQDGVIYQDFYFRFNTKGQVRVYSLSELVELKKPQFFRMPKWEFTLDGAEKIIPHSNAVSFGTQFYEEGDEFPLLYSTVYNNLASRPDPMPGTVLVYRLYREKGEFQSKLVQMIRIGFAEDLSLWKSYGPREEERDIRPYGNFLVNGEGDTLWAYVMRSKVQKTRFFAFPLPSFRAGEKNELGVLQVTLQKEDILRFFDTPFAGCIQGGTFYQGKIYSVEGLKSHPDFVPALRIIDTEKETETEHIVLRPLGLEYEPEMIDFYEDTCYFSNCEGGLYRLEF